MQLKFFFSDHCLDKISVSSICELCYISVSTVIAWLVLEDERGKVLVGGSKCLGPV